MEFTKEELKSAAGAAVAEFERETARAQSNGKTCHPHTVGKGKLYLNIIFNREIPRSGTSRIESWVDGYTKDPLSDQETNRAFRYGLHAGLGSLGLEMPERSGADTRTR